jgi:hypothetical protein
MITVKFEIGQAVALDRGAGDGNVPAGEFIVTRVMPMESGFRSYRVQGMDGVERAFQERQLRPGSGSPATTGAAATQAASAKWPKGRTLPDLI